MEFFWVDAFADRAFAGNPAGVCLVDDAVGDAWMQSVAAELGLSETAFVSTSGLEAKDYHLRWFTPTVEVDLCGHATLAAAHVLYTSGRVLAGQQARFVTRSGVLAAAQAAGCGISMDFPAEPVVEAAGPDGLTAALGAEPRWMGRNRFDVLVELEDESSVRRLVPNMDRLASIDTRGIIVTAPTRDGGYDFVSRFFGPAVGVPEDPVTGSAHCALGPYWGGRLGKSEVTGVQVSARGGTVAVTVNGDRVTLTGNAVTVLCGELTPPST